jgi:excisionase family DNA binding protein
MKKDQLKLLNARAVADLLSLHPLTVYLMAKQGRLPCVRIGKSLRFRESEILKLIKEGFLNGEPAA